MNVRRTRYYCPVEFAVDVIGGKRAEPVLWRVANACCSPRRGFLGRYSSSVR
ncbi:hypothetical protein ACTG9Q_06420 [Actinokineospora sp. 24-640]